jgi:hypothetical protein
MNSTTSFRRRPESSGFIQHAFGVCPCYAMDFFFGWIPACAGMTDFL